MTRLPFGIRIYLCWIIFLILTICPLFSPNLEPLWRIICWVGPLLLSLDADAGNRKWVYCAKFVVFILLNVFSLFLLYCTKGFQHVHSAVQRNWAFPIGLLLFFTSCTITVIGHRIRKTIWVGNYPRIKGTNNIFLADNSAEENPYAEYSSLSIRTPIKPVQLQGAWEEDEDGNRRQLTSEEVHSRVIRTAFVTQFVLSRIFKSVNDKVYVYSLLAMYRVRVTMLVLSLAGIYHILEGAFSKSVNRDIISSALLWLTLPSITLPALLKIKFGTSMNLSYLLKGLLPVESDKEMSLRLGIAEKDLYCALTNAVSARRILKDQILMISGKGNSNVKVVDREEACQLAKESLIRLEDKFVRVSDGEQFYIREYEAQDNKKHNIMMPLCAQKEWPKLEDLQYQKDPTETSAYDLSNQKDVEIAYSTTAKLEKTQSQMIDWGWDWKTHGGLLESFRCTRNGRSVFGRSTGKRRRPTSEEDRELLLRELAGEYYRNEIDSDKYSGFQKKISRRLDAAEIRKIKKKLRNGAKVSALVVGLIGMSMATGLWESEVNSAEEEEEEEGSEYDEADEYEDDNV